MKILIITGVALMIMNIVRYLNFLRSSRDVLSSGSKRGSAWKTLSFFLLVIFLIGYLFVGFLAHPDVMTALILFFGSVFAAIVETLISICWRLPRNEALTSPRCW